MSRQSRRFFSAILAAFFFLQTSVAVSGATSNTTNESEAAIVERDQRAAEAFNSAPPLTEVEGMPSMEVAALAVKFTYDPKLIEARIKFLKDRSEQREEAYAKQAKAADKEVAAKEKQLSRLPTTRKDPKVVEERKKIQCEIMKVKQGMTDKAYEFLQDQIARDVEISRLNLLEDWKASYDEIEQKIASGTAGNRKFGNVLDIGHRGSTKPFANQQKDVAIGRREVENARQRGQLPKPVQDPVVTEFVNRMAQNIARNSDLQVPLHVFVVKQEVRKDGRPVLGKDGQPEQVANAMALPGGYIFIFAGLVMSAQNESELAGVVAHEIAHITARHSARMSSRASKFGLLQMAAIIGLSLFAPGLFQAGSYLAAQLNGLLLQSIMNGLGLVFTINMLGVSRESEIEADQLGMQYAWKADYDPRGIITLFDWMASKSGYASRTSFFATHPAFGDRTLNSLKEFTILNSIEPNRHYLSDTQEFEQVKARLKKELYKTKAQIHKEETSRPSLRRGELTPEGCAAALASEPSSPGEK